MPPRRSASKLNAKKANLVPHAPSGAVRKRGRVVSSSALTANPPDPLAETYIPFHIQHVLRPSDRDDESIMTCLPASTIDSAGSAHCLITRPLERIITTTPGYPSPVPVPLKAMYRIAESAGKGLGLFAVCNISMGDLILAERPLTITHTPVISPQSETILQGRCTPETYEQIVLYGMESWYERLLSGMQAERRDAFMRLSNVHQSDGLGPITGRIRTNEIGQIEVTGPGKGPGTTKWFSIVCDDLSRLNHSCSPNTTRQWDAASVSMQLRATRDIQTGEEITTSYTDIIAPASSRQKYLALFDIQCTCSACLHPSLSDPRRLHCSQLLASMPTDWRSDAGLPTAESGLTDMQPFWDDLCAHLCEGCEGSEGYGYTLWRIMKSYGARREKDKFDLALEVFLMWQRAYPSGLNAGLMNTVLTLVYTVHGVEALCEKVTRNWGTRYNRSG